MIANLSKMALRRWISRDPDVAVPRLLELEKTWIEPLGSPLPEWWLSIRRDYAGDLYSFTPPPDPAAGIVFYQPLGARWCREYLSDASIPISGRTWLALNLGISLLTVGRADDAAVMLDLARNTPGGEALEEDPGWLRARFFVAQMSHGDRALARDILSKMDALVAAGKLSPKDDSYQIALQNYYMNLPLPDLDRQRQAWEMQEANQRNHPPYQNRKPTAKPQ